MSKIWHGKRAALCVATSSTQYVSTGGYDDKAYGSAHPAYQLYLNSLSPSGRRSVASMLARIVEYLGAEVEAPQYRWHSLTFENLESVRIAMRQSGYAPRSINLALAGARSVVRVAFQLEMTSAENVMRLDAIKNVRPKDKPAGRALSQSDIKMLLAACAMDGNKARGARDKAMLLIGIGAGLRVSELAALDAEDINSDTGCVRVHSGKGSKYREVHVSRKAVMAVAKWQRLQLDAAPAWCRISKSDNVLDARLTPYGITQVFNRLAAIAEVPRFTPHDLRRTFITQLLEQGVDLNFVRILAGHAHISSTSIYDRRDQSVLKQISRGLKIGEWRAGYFS